MGEVIETPNGPSSPLYSQAGKAGQRVYVSGLVGIDVSTGSLAGSTIQEQTRQASPHQLRGDPACGRRTAGCGRGRRALTNHTDVAGMNDEYATWLPDQPPTRYVAKLGVEILGVLVSMRMTAFVG